MNLEQRIKAFVQLGNFLEDFPDRKKESAFSNLFDSFEEVIKIAQIENGWFTRDNILTSLSGIRIFCKEDGLHSLIKDLVPTKKVRTIAIIMAGNLPAVGFHDLLCVLLSGNKVLIKLSSDDKVLISFIVRFLSYVEPEFENRILFSSGRLSDFDAVIATGSNNSSRYFEYYFGKYPHIIRKNRTSVAVLNGRETKDELSLLGKDIFTYYGLGCRNVSKLFVPKDYDFNFFFEAIFPFGKLMENKKYANNYEYSRTVYLLNKEPFLDNNFLIVKCDPSFFSPVAVLFFEEYESLEILEDLLKEKSEELQIIVSQTHLKAHHIPFGQSQNPGILDFADNVNTMRFISDLNS